MTNTPITPAVALTRLAQYGERTSTTPGSGPRTRRSSPACTPDDERMWLEKAAALRAEADQQEERERERTGLIPCSDCGTMVRTRTLESLPEHRCIQRQRARRERETADRTTEK
ncbi:hypothetical protein [Streptomyces sp. NPDC095613]|uniref:hypothetical protein n=1 Tax=Streptomyces sp. NPDC095613 TaxID=3155540 RepID=UPI00331D3E34